MTKRTTFKRTIRGLTRKPSLDAALADWSVLSIINLDKYAGKMQACELCGTRFYRGAWVSYPSKRVRIAVGGDCLQTLLERRFTARREISKRRREIRMSLTRRYGAIVDPGNWIRWIIENAPPRLAGEVAELMRFQAVSSGTGLKKLVAFHDEHRRYPREALLRDAEMLALPLGLSEYLTINQARRLVDASRSMPYVAKIIAARRARSQEQFLGPPYVTEDSEKVAWNHLDELGQRTVLALFALSLEFNGSEVCSNTLALNWPAVGALRIPSFVWSPRLGLGFVHCDPEEDPPWSRVLVWQFVQRDYTKTRVDMSYVRRTTGAPPQAVEELEALAFRRPILLAKLGAGD